MFAKLKQLKECWSLAQELGKMLLNMEQRFSSSAGLRIFWTASVGFFIAALPSAYVVYKREAYNSEIKAFNRRVTSQSYESQLHLSLSKIQLCKANQNEGPALRDWYCGDAIEAYKANNNRSENKARTELVAKKNAFGTMELEVANLILREQLSREKEPTLPIYIEIWKTFSDGALLLLSIFILVPITFFCMRRLHHGKVKDALPKLEI